MSIKGNIGEALGALVGILFVIGQIALGFVIIYAIGKAIFGG